MNLYILSGGAVQGLVRTIEPLVAKDGGMRIVGSFGAVGAMKEKFVAGEPCDLIILTETLIAELARQRRVVPDTCAPLGRVRTGVAVREGSPLPELRGAGGLRDALSAANGIYFPDPQRATAGIHFMKILRALGMDQELAGRLRPHPNGATAMREMAAARDEIVIGCTQVTEIVTTPGVRLAGPLPREFELVTTYAVAVSAQAAQPEQARLLAGILAGPQSADVRAACGME
jgi:molybdate transport system substrate-binding protein